MATTATTHTTYVLKGVAVWNADGVAEGRDVWVEKGIVTAITSPNTKPHDNATVIPAEGYALLPAGVDCQVHLRVPGQPQKETPLHGLTAALAGGIGAVVTMPNTVPVIDTPDVLAYARKETESAEEKTGVKVFFTAAITRGQKGRELVDVAALKEAGVVALTDDGVGVARNELMAEAFAAAAKFDLPILQHAEVPGHGGVLAAGPMQERLKIKPYPASAEADMVARDIDLLRQHPKARYHVLHVSSEETLQHIHVAKMEGLRVTCEVTPHHLFFTSDDIGANNSAFKMNPPLRSADDRHALLQALSDGLCDFVSTDHAPHESDLKGNDFKTAAFGTTGLETSLRVLITLWREGMLTPTRLVEVFSTAPARFLGLSDDFGAVKVGKRLRAVLVDVNGPSRVVTTDDLHSLSHNNCFLGSKLAGRILQMFNGDRVWKI